VPTLGELLDSQRGAQAIHETSDGETLVGFRIHDGPHKGWRLGFRLQRRDDFAPWEVEEVTVRPARGQGVGAADIRNLPLGRYLAKARSAATAQEAGAPSAEQRLVRPSDIDVLLAFASRGPKRDLDYAQLALRYTQLVQAGDRKPAETIAAEAGHGSPAVWTNRLVQARNKRGLLTAAKRGEAGGELTPKALNLLGFE
jgi:hypothetical protein